MANKVVVKKRRRIRWSAVVLALLACVLVLYLFGSLLGALFGGSSKDDNAFSVCKLSNKKLQKMYTDVEYKGEILVTDYVIYGEGISLYSGEYLVGGRNAFTGKTMILKNICTGKEYTIDKLGSELNGQIQAMDLEVGLYEMYIVDNLLEKRLYMDQTLIKDVSIYTSTKKNENTKVSLIADISLFDKEGDEEHVLDRDYLFLNVTKEALPETYVDVMLNPGPISISNNIGLEANGVSEETEMYRLAKRVKELLEKEGLKVGIAREEYSWLSTYGETGTVARGYDAGAKYFISFAANGGSSTQQGVNIVHSSFVSGEFANAIYDQYKAQTNMVVSDVMVSERSSGYDSDIDIRESGGRALGAGELVEKNKFALNYNGMESLYLEVFNINNPEDVALWQTEFENVAKAIAQGIIDYIYK